jgi:GNAT superfamily N-acetyltransferase
VAEQSPDFTIRPATLDDAPVLAWHRAGMFRDMGSVADADVPALQDASLAYFRSALPAGEYVAWVAHPTGKPEEVIAGAGVQLRSLLPRPAVGRPGLLLGLEGLVLNVYVEPAWRRRGVARRLMEEVLRWAPGAGIVRLVLHASREGRRLYEQMDFVATNEMRYTGPLAERGPVRGMP